MVIFNDRIDAGEKLANELSSLHLKLKDPIVLGIPRGGIPIGHCIASEISAPLDTIILRKLPVPSSPETGFGAVTLEKKTIFNQEFINYFNINSTEIEKIVNTTYKEVLRRNEIYRKNLPFPDLKGRSVIITDDGLATGITMLAACSFVKEKKAKEVIVACPVAHRQAYELVEVKSDKMVVLHISDTPFFAVASFYRIFNDMADEEVIFYLDKYLR